MKLVIFSDVHGNLEALTAVRESVALEDADRVICLGDVVGYGASPNECCRIVREIADEVVLGNHDAAVCGRMDLDYYYDSAHFVLTWTAGLLTEENMHWLRSLPVRWDSRGISFTHGSPVRPEMFEYIFNIEHVISLVENDADLPVVAFLGHSHLYRTFAVAGREIYEVSALKYSMRRDTNYIVSVGSVGQPRDFDARACYAVFDTERKIFELKRVEYDVDRAAARIEKAGLPVQFARRLKLGL